MPLIPHLCGRFNGLSSPALSITSKSGDHLIQIKLQNQHALFQFGELGFSVGKFGIEFQGRL